MLKFLRAVKSKRSSVETSVVNPDMDPVGLKLQAESGYGKNEFEVKLL